MDRLFLQIISMSVTATYVIIFVIATRLLLKKFPKIFSYVLWFAVLFRLIIPFSFESVLSLIPDVHIPQDIAYLPKPEINSGIAVVDSAVNSVLPSTVNLPVSVNPMQVWLAIGVIIWVIGMCLLLIYSVFTSVKLYRNLRYAKHMEDNIYTMDGLKTPFVFGVINPKIYLPANLSENEKPYILLHEQIHIKRFDHIVKAVFFLVTCIHWFNPFVWPAFYLLGEDMELSCDERVVKEMGSTIKKEYSSSLLAMSTGRKIVGGCPISFGENNTKGRIKNVLNYKKPALWFLVVAVIIIIVIIAALITNPKSVLNLNDLRPMLMVNGELYLDTGKQLSVEIDESEIIGEIKSSVYGSEKPVEEGQTNFGLIGAKYAHFENNIAVLINNEWVLFEKEVNNAMEANSEETNITNYERISAYMEEECRKAFSPYYDLLDFIITDYQEEVVNGNIEAVFIYTLIHKNYDRDPDTVEYIKEAKERGSENYQQMYDEYLQPKEMNFHLKTVTDENGEITLYSNISPVGIQWEETEMTDYIIKQPEEILEN
ncbi:MAG: hypothetical protein GX339_09700 [Tissierellia bacterium]|nr:hypothetical protein [Tissierellia bacterium]